MDRSTKSSLPSPTLSEWIKSFGPGFLFAGSAIGVSHLVQSTRAGAMYGYSMIWMILLANLFKYPFFEFATRYANATGESLIEGYRRIGRWALWLYIVITMSTMWIMIAAVTIVTAAMSSYFFDPGISLAEEALLLLSIALPLLIIGNYSLLDKIMKGIVFLLTISTIAAVIIAWQKPTKVELFSTLDAGALLSGASLTFSIALMGWMPAPIDVSVWSSLWTVARQNQSECPESLKRSSIDFNIGYIGTALIALCFMSLGANVMYGSGKLFSNSGIAFTKQFFSMYLETLGWWTWPIILAAATSSMFSTTLAVLDGYARVAGRVWKVVFPYHPQWDESRLAYGIILLAEAGATYFIINQTEQKILTLVDIATVISFLSNPLLAYLNFRVVYLNNVPPEYKPPHWLRGLSYAGLLFLIAFAILFLLHRGNIF